jgi:DNA-binding GntR family transcriptional regulator
MWYNSNVGSLPLSTPGSRPGTDADRNLRRCRHENRTFARYRREPRLNETSLKDVVPALNQDRLSEQVYERLKDAIIDGVFTPGERLSVQDLAEHFQISSTPIRDALKLLETDRLVEVVPRKGTYVSRFERVAVQETYQIRRIIECACVEEVANAPVEIIQQLVEVAQEIEDLQEGEKFRDYGRYIKLDTRFHRLLVGLLRNERLSELYEALRWPGQLMRGLSHAGYQRAAETAREHRAIAQAVAERQVDKARQAISEHLRRAEQDLVARLPS